MSTFSTNPDASEMFACYGTLKTLADETHDQSLIAAAHEAFALFLVAFIPDPEQRHVIPMPRIDGARAPLSKSISTQNGF
jgi:hypothetical protein